MICRRLTVCGLILVAFAFEKAEGAESQIDFNRHIRTILSNNCFKCHGPDEKQRKGGDKSKGGLRLDIQQGSRADLGGYQAIVPGDINKSELVRRINASDDDVMPPKKQGKKLTSQEMELLTRWIEQGANYARHWSYVKPTRSALPKVNSKGWPENAVDYFVLARLEKEGLKPSPQADRYTLIRRVSLDLTGLPPTLKEVDQFVNDKSSDAYQKQVDRLLHSSAYGEHWARVWLDLARYADSAGYADDPLRTIWGYRDWVIRALNKNLPFDQFTIEQLAGDLLPNPTEEQLVATAFHRNTLTNNEGGTNDEEFRNVAVVDRVNTTMAVWMGTTMACAQCHNHKYDPITNEEYFKFFAFFNQSEDADRKNESPTIGIITSEQKRQKEDWQKEIAALEEKLKQTTPELVASQKKWESGFKKDIEWLPFEPSSMKSTAGAKLKLLDDGSILAGGNNGKTDTYTLHIKAATLTPAIEQLEQEEGEEKDGPDLGAELEKKELKTVATITAIHIEALTHESLPNQGPGRMGGNFVLSRLSATVLPPAVHRVRGRYLRIENPGKKRILSLAEVQVFDGAQNIARGSKAKQSSTGFNGPPHLAIDGNTNGHYFNAKSTTHTAIENDPWWELDLAATKQVDRIVIWNRTDGGRGTMERLKNFKVLLLDVKRQTIWEKKIGKYPNPKTDLSLSGAQSVAFATAYADFSQKGFNAGFLAINPNVKKNGWAVAPEFGKPHAATLIAARPFPVMEGAVLEFRLEQLSQHAGHNLGRFLISYTDDPHAATYSKTPSNILSVIKVLPEKRTAEQKETLSRFYRTVVPELQPTRDRLDSLKKQLANLKPATTVPIMRDLPKAKRRKTHIQIRGNFLVKDKEVSEGVPAAFNPIPKGQPMNRLGLAKWLVGKNNPLTARVTVNRHWEQIFGIGLVRTSEEFGTQGELPSHPRLLDWLATELVASNWDIKKLLKVIVTSAAYMQSSKVSEELIQRDPYNRLLTRGPRFRLSAEMIRDQALAVSGLLSRKMYGRSVQPPRPMLRLKAAFGGSTDWKTSPGEDKFRRGLYTSWRRSLPYPSMATFDAPSREVCTVRRTRTNTPLQALVTLNDPVYIEAAQALARRIVKEGGSTIVNQAAYGFRLCLSRSPGENELKRLVELFRQSHQRYSKDKENAAHLATNPLGPAPPGSDISELAAWTVVGNVLLNLDEMLAKR